jgi:hypothetical protein
MTNDILLHVRGYRQLTIGDGPHRDSLPEHMAIIEALEGAKPSLRKSARAITRSALPPMSKPTARTF